MVLTNRSPRWRGEHNNVNAPSGAKSYTFRVVTMALGPDNFNLTISLGSVFVFQGDDVDDVFDSASEPYLWVFMVKVDAEGLHQDGNFLAGSPTYFFSPGSHGNIGGSIEHGSRDIPAEVGTWTTSLRPIPVTVAGQPLVTIPGTILCAAVLMEENLTPDDAVEKGHQAVITLIKNTMTDTLGSLGLAGLAADAAAEVAIDASHGITTPIAVAGQRVLQRRLKPVQDLFQVAAPADVAITILQNLDLGGFLGSAVDADKPMGTFIQTFSQADLANTVESAPFMPGGSRITIKQDMFNMPEWAFTLHGQAWAHHKFVRRATPTTPRLQVTCTSKRGLGQAARRVASIGGIDNGAFWQLSRGEAADAINQHRHTFFVKSADGSEIEVVSQQGGFVHGRPWFFVQTTGDTDPADNLLHLPDCPAGGDVDEFWTD